MTVRILTGDASDRLRELPDGSVHCCVTSPPYWSLRDYGTPGQLGLERTPEEWVANMVGVFREVRRVLRDDGTCWVNVGDAFDSKQLIGQPWRLAFALQADGWWLRSDIIWSKPNPMPESVTDRPTKAHEYVFLLTKAALYYYDADAVREDAIHVGRIVKYDGTQKNCKAGDGANDRRTLITRTIKVGAGRNLRSVWTIPTHAFLKAHFATFPTKLVEPCVKAGSPKGGTVLDPFVGSGTTALVADRLGRNAIGIELNTEYAEMARRRVASDAPLFADVAINAPLVAHD